MSRPLPALPFAAYNVLLHALLPALVPALLAARLAGKRVGRTWRGQLGLDLPLTPACEGSVWIQASSVGECRVAQRLISELRRTFPGSPVLLTSTTPEGLRIAREGAGADHVFAFPFDFPWIVSRWFDAFRPQLCLVVETEIWPNFIRACAGRRVPLVLVNGRLSPSRMTRYRRLGRFYRAFLEGFSLLLMQSDEDAARVLELGADPSRVQVMGDMKYDSLPGLDGGGMAIGLAAGGIVEAAALVPSGLQSRDSSIQPPAVALQPHPAVQFLVAGSTHPGESESVLDAYRLVRQRFPGLGCVLAPRHPETAEAVARHAQAAGLQVARRSQGGEPAAGQLLLLDTVGELAAIYALASVAFVGGSLVPVGGHSLLEPASLGKPVLHGPLAFNFAGAVRLLSAAGASRQVANGEELASAVSALLADPVLASEMGRRGREAVLARSGAARRTAERLGRLLAERAR